MTYPLARSHLLLEFRRSGGRLSIPIEQTVSENKQFNGNRVQNRQNVVGISKKGENQQTFFPEPFLLSRESPSWDLAFTSSTDLYVFTCARADQLTIKKNSPCALGARALLDKLSVPLNYFFFHQKSMYTETIKLSTILGCK